MTYYNTTKLMGLDLVHEIYKAKSQQQAIMNLFRFLKSATPSQIWKLHCDIRKDVPITSIRRAITDLTIEGRLIKTTDVKPGIYGKPEFIWKISL